MKNISLTASLFAAGSLLLATTALAQESKPDAEGYIRDWVMLAPIPLNEENAGATKIDEEQVKGEGALKPKEGDKAMAVGKEIAWKNVHLTTNSFNLNEILKSENENVAAYMVAYLVCDQEMPNVTLFMGSNDQGKVYLNGKEVVKFAETRTMELDADKAEKLTLVKGVNAVVFKVINENNNWEGSLRFKAADGKPVTNIKVKLTP